MPTYSRVTRATSTRVCGPRSMDRPRYNSLTAWALPTTTTNGGCPRIRRSVPGALSREKIVSPLPSLTSTQDSSSKTIRIWLDPLPETKTLGLAGADSPAEGPLGCSESPAAGDSLGWAPGAAGLAATAAAFSGGGTAATCSAGTIGAEGGCDTVPG